MVFGRLTIAFYNTVFIVLTHYDFKCFCTNINTNKSTHAFKLRYQSGIILTGSPTLNFLHLNLVYTKSLLSFWILFEISKEVGATLHTRSEYLPQGRHGFPSKLLLS